MVNPMRSALVIVTCLLSFARQACGQTADQALIARGEYLAKAGDCAGCHTAPKGGAPFAGGLGMASPFGTIVSSNVTPDKQYGIGEYTYDDFARTLREGVARGGKHLYPAMPYPSFSKIDDDDMHALYAYFLHGVQPVAKAAAPTRLPFPFNQRWALAFWNFAFAPKGRYAVRTDHDAQWNRGAYLVQSLGHCGACHTPRGPAYEERGYTESSRLYLTGGTNDHWFAPNLTGDPGAGLGRVHEAEIAAFLKSGHGGDLVTFGSMVQVVEDSMQYMNDDDLNAIAHYLKSLPAEQPSGAYGPRSLGAQQTTAAARTGNIERPGAGIYLSYCAKCHGGEAQGMPQKYPKLAGNPSVLSPDTTSLIRLMIEGGNSPDTQHGPPRKNMPAYAGMFTDTEIAQVLTFIRTTWGNNASAVTTRDVIRLRDDIHK
ncbi:putative diheme cytochrome c-553 [Caballeronia sordidicola]|uniref:Putative diheme cytochrome c-553 n=2 Tax=Caballeronia sordidicola TaxID=196367 RepID=A0A242N981_CABSO|nr:putative diheme cytochrome c-553 [Caballeronia sordidicola]